MTTDKQSRPGEGNRMNASIWIVDDDRNMRWVLETAFRDEGMTVSSFEEPVSALKELAHATAPDVILTDIRMPEMDGLTFVNRLKASHPQIPVIVMTAHSDLESAVSSYQTGAFEYLPKPFDLDEAISLVERAVQYHAQRLQEQEQMTSRSASGTNAPVSTPDIIGESPAMQEVFRAIGRLSQSHITVLINGESGTGKELVAHALHRHSPRRSKPFIALNMAAIPRELMETELFGHEKGAFTGAASQRQGRFEQANGGTLFLDEIGDMPFETQTRLLRVLADGVFYRVGGHVPVRVDVRIIAATHQHLQKLVTAGKFREDLYHRLNVIRVHIPPLRERREDIVRLARHFLLQAGRELGVEPKQMHPQTQELLAGLPWPGNVRQLENTCRYLTVMASGNDILPNDLPSELQALQTDQDQDQDQPSANPASVSGTIPVMLSAPDPANPADITGSASPATQPVHAVPVPAQGVAATDWQTPLRNWAAQQLATGARGLLDEAMPAFERILLDATLTHCRGRKGLAAERLGWGRNTLTRKLRELDMADD